MLHTTTLKEAIIHLYTCSEVYKLVIIPPFILSYIDALYIVSWSTSKRSFLSKSYNVPKHVYSYSPSVLWPTCTKIKRKSSVLEIKIGARYGKTRLPEWYCLNLLCECQNFQTRPDCNKKDTFWIQSTSPDWTTSNMHSTFGSNSLRIN